jgi:peptidoglycan-N-acetylglucosamine deacetylase
MGSKYFCLYALAIALLLMSGSPGARGEGSQNSNPMVYHHGPTTGKYVALTFDDAPAEDSQKLLDVLDQLDVKATFFAEGLFVSLRPDQAKAIVECGQEIGNHTYDHLNITTLTPEQLRDEIESTDRVIFETTGATSRLFRPPGGAYDQKTIQTVYNCGDTTVLWTSLCGDYKNPSVDFIVDRIVSRVKPGGIILLHDGIPHTREALPQIVNTLRAEGYTFVTVGEMIDLTNGAQASKESDYDPQVAL